MAKDGSQSSQGSSLHDDAVWRQSALAFALLDAESPRAYDWVFDNVDGYAGDATHEAKVKMLGRDIDQLRRVGVPARRESNKVWINNDSYELPPIEFTEAEATVLGLAGDLGQAESLGGFARSGWTKLAASGATRTFDSAPLSSLDNDITRLTPETFRAVSACVRNQRRMSFDYQRTPTAPVERRVMDPWGFVAFNNYAYVVGWDLLRQAERSFRALRMANVKQVRGNEFTPQTRPLQEIVEDSLRGPLISATFQVVSGTADELTQRARQVGEDYVVDNVERDWFVRTAASVAPNVVVTGPTEIREAVMSLLKEASPNNG